MALKFILFTVILMGTFLATAIGQEGRRRAGDPPNQGTGELFITPNPLHIPKTLKDLSDRSTLIVEAIVKKTLPSRETSPRALETDAVIDVVAVLKGPPSVRELVISQRGGSKDGLVITPVQYSLVQAGTKCLLFLTEDKRSDAPAIDVMKRYFITGTWSGLLCVENDTIRVNAKQPDHFRLRYEGLTIEQVKKELQALATTTPN